MENKKISLGDRYAETTVLVITIIALMAGWFYKSSVENSSVPFNVEGITAQAPKGWLQSEPSGDELLRTIDRSSSGFSTTYTLRKIPLAAGTSFAQVSSLLTLGYGQDLLAFRVLDQREVTVFDKTAYEISYVFVESNPDLTHKNIPSVVRGADYIFVNGSYAVVVSFQADEKNYDPDLNRFHLFLESISY
ncbi:MAG: hypothetical protein HOP27_16745 [Anaerolineales bacterium]|nr:hypothetical protein [Anaerolineales bacterium]